MKKSNLALAITENSAMFGLKARDMVFGSDVNMHEFFRGQQSHVCFIDDDTSNYDDETTLSDDDYEDTSDEGSNANDETLSESDADEEQEKDEEDSDADEEQQEEQKQPNTGKNQTKKRISEKEAKLLKEVMKWKEKAKSAQQELSSKESKITDIIGDISQDELKELIDAKKQREIRDREARGEYESIVNQMIEQHAAELFSKDKEVKDRDTEIAELKTMLVDASNKLEDMAVGRQFSDSSFIKDRLTLPPSIARQIFGSHFEVEEGKLVGYNKPRGAQGRAPLVNSQAETLGFEAAIERLITSHPENKTLLRSTMKPGSNSSTTSNTAPVEPEAPKKLSGAELIRKALADKK